MVFVKITRYLKTSNSTETTTANIKTFGVCALACFFFCHLAGFVCVFGATYRPEKVNCVLEHMVNKTTFLPPLTNLFKPKHRGKVISESSTQNRENRPNDLTVEIGDCLRVSLMSVLPDSQILKLILT